MMTHIRHEMREAAAGISRHASWNQNQLKYVSKCDVPLIKKFWAAGEAFLRVRPPKELKKKVAHYTFNKTLSSISENFMTHHWTDPYIILNIWFIYF